MIRVIGIGDNVVDKYVHQSTYYPGGCSVNFSVFARKLGYESAFLGLLGRDEQAAVIKAGLKKYGVDYRALGRQAKKQGWVAERDRHRQEVRQLAVEQATEKKIDRLLRFQKLTDKLLGKVEIFIEQADPKALDARALRSITAALKDMKEIQAVRSEAELREQELRLRLLERQEADSRTDRKFIVQIEGGEEDWSR